MAISPDFHVTTLVELLRYRAQHQPDRRIFTFLKDGETEDASVTHAQLDRQARAIAAQLQCVTAPGERALLLYPSGLEFIAAFFGCLYAGIIAVPCYPPRRNRPDARIQTVATDARVSVILTTTDIFSERTACCTHNQILDSMRWLVTAQLADDLANDWKIADVRAKTLAFLQYTSGTTGSPKGVMVSHRNILVNTAMIADSFAQTEHSIGVSWLPLFHDMGLIGNIIHPLYLNAFCVLMSPAAFLQKPVRWLQAIAKYKATCNGGPNFAYELCVQKITDDQRADLDLRSWEVAFNGAEPVRADTLERFYNTFESCGFRREAFHPCYGMAEATLLIAGSVKLSAPVIHNSRPTSEQNRGSHSGSQTDSFKVVSCGRLWGNQRVTVRHPETWAPCPEQQVGEIWVAGEHVSQGYWNRPAETSQTFHAYIADTGEGPFLRTGDLGYMEDGELFVTGRLKELIIIRGQNYYPQDIEATVEQSHLALQPGNGAAFSVERGDEERLIIVQEVRRTALRHLDIDVVIEAIRKAVSEQYDVSVSAIALLKPGQVPKTSSGKIQRHTCREQFLLEELAPVGEWNEFEPEREPESPTEESGRAHTTHTEIRDWLIKQLAHRMRIDPQKINPLNPLTSYGIDSVTAISLSGQLAEWLGVRVTPSMLYDYPTLDSLAQAVAAISSESSEPVHDAPVLLLSPEQRYAPFPLTDIQEVYWVGRGETFELGNVSTHVYIELDCNDLNLHCLQDAWQTLIQRHDMLRMIILPTGQQQVLESVPPYQIACVDVCEEPDEVIAQTLNAVRRELSHQVLPAGQWPLFDIRATRFAPRTIRLHLSFDALMLDAWSLYVLKQEWSRLYQAPNSLLPPLVLTFRDYVIAGRLQHTTDAYQRSQEYWLSRLDTLPPAPELPLAKSPESIIVPKFQRRSATLSRAEWQTLQQWANEAGLTPSGLVLAAFAETLRAWSKSPCFTLNLTLFNRLPLHSQVDDILGDFTNLLLLEVDHAGAQTFLQRAKRIHRQLWQDLEHRSMSGVRVQRDLAHRQHGTRRVFMPVVFTSMLALTQADDDDFQHCAFGDVVYSISQTPQVWLDHQVFEHEGALVLNWDAVEELFPDGMLDQMFDAYCRFLRQLAASESAWKTLPMLVPASHLAQYADVNATQAPISDDLLHTAFIKQAQLQGDAYALISSRRNFTYAELHQRVNQLGTELRESGAVPNTLIAVVMEKGWKQVVAVLGILMSGAAYVPIDPELPQERQWYLLEQGQVDIVLTTSECRQRLCWPEEVLVICVDADHCCAESEPDRSPVQVPTDLAYVIFTSGSTGQPKGVAIDHRGAVNTILDMNRRFEVGPSDRILALSALSFDLSVYDIFGVLAAGGALVLPDAQHQREPSHWADLMRQHRVTVWNSVPALMQMFVEYMEAQTETPPDSLRLSLMSGDWIQVSLPGRMKKLWPQAQTISLGGATEASIWSIFYPIEAVDPAWTSIPYGKPLTNQTLHVLDHALQPRPVRVPGDLYIGGTGLARKYWRDAEKTSQSFIVHPETGERLYKTGDLGRYLPDGAIEFLGREDSQVKIRGYRIELGEIEAVLQQHPAVKQAVVATSGQSREHQQLVAYFVANQASYTTDDYAAATRGIMLDPIERLEFKLKQPGLRTTPSEISGISLVKPNFDESFTRAYLERQSYRKFVEDTIPFEHFSMLLSCLLQLPYKDSPLPKYRYPSAGNLYPVQTYLSVKPGRVEGLEGGTYYYHPTQHRLVNLTRNSGIPGTAYGEYGDFNQSIFEQSAFALFLIGQLDAIRPMYGEWARDFCLLEAGYMSQLLMESAPHHRIGLCPIGYLRFEEIEALFQFDEGHILLHSFLGGGIEPKQMTPWFQTSSHHAVALDESLRCHLERKLPAYMLPARYVQLDTLPLTANGKIDHKALPQSASPSDHTKKGYVPPQTATEERLITLWSDILHVERLGIHDDFFELGGDSLLAMRLLSRIREEFQVELPLRELFDKTIVAELAEFLDAMPTTTSDDYFEGEL